MYHYEIHFHNIPPGQSEYLEHHFIDYTWQHAFAAIDWVIKRQENSIIFKFSSHKFFDVDSDTDTKDNLYTFLAQKEQFFCEIYFKFLNDDLEELDIDRMKTIFVVDDRTKWRVELGKYSTLEKIEPSQKRTFEGIAKLKGFAEYVRDRELLSN